MSKRKGIRVLSTLALCAVLVCSFSLTAFAYADDTEQNLPVTEATQPEEMPETETPAEMLPAGEPIDDEGNASTRDLLYDKATNKQFITIQTKNGNTFYIVIDYDAPINEEEEQYQTYFLNMVDESDLLALMDEDSVAALTTCSCTEKCEAGHVNTSCPVCKTNMSECAGTAPEPEAPAEEPEPVADEKPQKNSNMGMIIVIIAVAGIGGAGYYYIKYVRGKKQKDEDMDFFDDEGYEEEPYINEDEEPQMKIKRLRLITLYIPLRGPKSSQKRTSMPSSCAMRKGSRVPRRFTRSLPTFERYAAVIVPPPFMEIKV